MHFLHVHKICKLLIGIGVVLLSASCADNQYDNSCYLIFDNSTNNNSKVAAAMTISSNVFVTFSKKSINGKPYFHIESNQGGTDDVAFTYQDQQRGYILAKTMESLLVLVFWTINLKPMTFFALTAITRVNTKILP